MPQTIPPVVGDGHPALPSPPDRPALPPPPSAVPPPPPPTEPAKPQIAPRRARWRWLAALIALSALLLIFSLRMHNKPAANQAGRGTGAKSKGPSATPVVAVKARSGDIGVYVTGLGAVTPIFTDTIRSRVDGQLMSVHFKEGELVHRGDLLIEIDERPYQAALEQAEGQLLRDQAALENARVDLARYTTLLKQDAIPEQQLATQQATVKQDEGTVKADQGMVDTARLNVTYCRITAPITGIVGLRLVDPGNIVHASDTNGMLVITQVQPISVIFTVAEDQLPPIVQKYRAGQRLPVDAYDREMKNKLASGTLATIDNQIDQTTGTLKLRAIFENPDMHLFPNQFVNARLLEDEKHGVTLLQSAAIQRNTNSTYVFLVKPDNTVTIRQIGVGTVEGDQSQITSGLQPGDEVVMTGVDKLEEGSKVVPHLSESGGNSGNAPSAHGASGQGTSSFATSTRGLTGQAGTGPAPERTPQPAQSGRQK